MDISKFSIDSTTVHYVGSPRDEDDPQVLLTSSTIELDGELTKYFTDKSPNGFRSRAWKSSKTPKRITPRQKR